jgi:CubicO group peptidase (beta-lactamase class C family)
LLTTIAALQCVERGLISLDDDVSQALPELKDLQIISAGADEGTFELTPAKSKITLRHLLSHTSGINYDAMDPLTLAWRKSRGECPLVFTGRVKESYTTPLLFEPGESWVYGGGIDWAGILVSKLNGDIELGNYMEKNLFQVLGLKSSTFDLKARPELENRLIEMNNRGSDGILVAIPSPYANPAPEHSGGMGLVTSVADFAAVLKDLLKISPALLKAETVESMFRPQFSVGTVQYKGLLAQQVCFHSSTKFVSR